jgi:hypothetical protein
MPDIRKLTELHPLYRRLSGQVIWLMFEEHEAPEKHIGAFLERYERLKRENLELLALALETPSEFTHLLLEPARTGHICSKCAAVSGAAVELNRIDPARRFPPFGLGCALRPKLLTMDEFERMDLAATNPAETDFPEHKLLCGEWIFGRPWAGESDPR